MKDFSSNHTRIEKTLHQLAFKPWYPRISLSNFESVIYKKRLEDVSIKKPVFITALPRAGTTLLLKLCIETNEFVSHTYSDMPFILTPIIWDHFSKSFRKSGVLSERVHGDGILVNVDSPESFEEIIWKEFWISRYKKDRIIPWKEDRYPEFEEFFIEHMRKLIFLRGNEADYVRYVSKNNMNIARIKYLSQIFPDATIITLFRSPIQQASSLLKQHQNFLDIHEKDIFARKYMEDTGHFDFGENLRPINFFNWFSKQDHNPNTLSFWLRYWINTYKYQLRKNNDRVHFFSYDSFCEDPKNGLEKLGRILDIRNKELLRKMIGRIKRPKPYIVNNDGVEQELIDQAEDIFLELLEAEKGF